MHPDGPRTRKPWDKINFEETFGLNPQTNNVVEQFKLKEVSHNDFIGIDTYQNYKLKELTEELTKKGIFLDLQIVRTFCESKGELKTISDEEEIILMDDVRLC